jgi:hypothetical protein
MFDIIAAMSLTGLAVAVIAILIWTGAQTGSARVRLAVLGALWFAAVAGLSLAECSRAPGIRNPSPRLTLVTPILVGAGLFAFSRSAREFVLHIPPAVLVAVNFGRIVGAFFVALYAAGRLPPTFALSAGLGDIYIGLEAVPLASAIYREIPGWRPLTLAWNTIGVLDLVVAVTLGIGSAAQSPLRFIFERPESSLLATLPWSMIPGFLVPIYLLMHFTVFVHLTKSAAAASPAPRRLSRAPEMVGPGRAL